MSQSINFLAENKTLINKRQKSDKRSFMIIAIFAGIGVLIYAILFALNLYFGNQESNLSQEIEQIEADITTNLEAETNYLDFYARLETIEAVINAQNANTTTLETIYRHFTTLNIAISSLVYDYYSQSIELTITANGAPALPELFTLVQEQSWQENLSSVEMLGLNRSGNGLYTLEIEIEI